jgi:hypothetical protein
MWICEYIELKDHPIQPTPDPWLYKPVVHTLINTIDSLEQGQNGSVNPCCDKTISRVGDKSCSITCDRERDQVCEPQIWHSFPDIWHPRCPRKDINFLSRRRGRVTQGSLTWWLNSHTCFPWTQACKTSCDHDVFPKPSTGLVKNTSVGHSVRAEVVVGC